MAINKKFVVKNGLVAPNAEITGVLTADSIISGNTSLDTLVDTAYTNAVSYADILANTTYANAVSYTDTAVANLIDTAPDALNTLNELSAALNDDPDFANTIVGQITTAYTNATSYTDAEITALGLGSLSTQNSNSVNIDGGTIDGTAVNATTLAYSGTLTGGTGVVNLGSGQVFKDENGNVGIGTTAPNTKLYVASSAAASVPSAGGASSHLAVGETDYGTMIGTLGSGDGYIQQQRFNGVADTFNLLLQPNGGNVGIGGDPGAFKLQAITPASNTLQSGLNISNGSNADFTVKIKNNETQIGPSTNTPLVFTNNSSTPRMSITSTGNVLPGANATQDLGSDTLRWNTVYTSDLSLKNDHGDWTVVEGEDDLFLYNNKKGKVYKFALTEVDPDIAPPKRD